MTQDEDANNYEEEGGDGEGEGGGGGGEGRMRGRSRAISRAIFGYREKNQNNTQKHALKLTQKCTDEITSNPNTTSHSQ